MGAKDQSSASRWMAKQLAILGRIWQASAATQLPEARGDIREIVGQPVFVPLYKLFQVYGKIFKLSFGPKTFVVISDPKYARQILLTRADKYSKGLLSEILEFVMGTGLIPADGETWRIRRRAIVPALHKKYVASMASASGKSLDMENYFSRLALDIIGKAVFNYDYDSLTHDDPVIQAVYTVLREAEHRSVQPLPYWNLPGAKTLVPRQKKCVEALLVVNKSLDDLIAKSKKLVEEEDVEFVEEFLSKADPSILHFLLASGEQVSSKQLRDDLMTMLIAGHETTAAVLTWTFYLLATHPEVSEKLREEVDRVLGDRTPTIADMKELAYTTRVINESMRLYPQPPVLLRRALVEDKFDNFVIPAGSDIFISVWNLHRSPALWEDSDSFKPERFPITSPIPNETTENFSYLPFGGGKRKCIGDQFALFESIVALSMLTRRYDFTLDPNGPAVGMTTGATIHTTAGLFMNMKPRAGTSLDRTISARSSIDGGASGHHTVAVAAAAAPTWLQRLQPPAQSKEYPEQEQQIARLTVKLGITTASILKEKEALKPWDSIRSDTFQKLEADLLLAEHSLAINSFALMIPKAVDYLNHIVDTSATAHPLIKALLCIIYTSVHVVTILPSCWPIHTYLLGNTKLYSALDALTTWHLRVSRLPAARPRHPSFHSLLAESCPEFLSTVLKATAQSVVGLMERPAPEMCKLARSLPAGFLPRLCCQLCEELAAYLVPPHAPRMDTTIWATLQVLLWTIWRCVECSIAVEGGHEIVCRLMLGPSVLVASKMMIAFFGVTDPVRRPVHVDPCLLDDALGAVIRQITTLQPWTANGSCNAVSDGDSGSGNAAAPVPRVSFDDAQLVRAVRLISLSRPELLGLCTAVLEVLMERPGSDMPPAVRDSCLLGMAHHCSQHMRLRMSRQGQQARALRPRVQPMALCPDGTMADEDVIELRTLLLNCLLSEKQAYNRRKGPGPKQPPYNLMNWVYLKGSVPVMEALLRGHHRPRDLGDCCDASTALTFLIALASDTPAVLPACLSIASTLHKLLREQGREVVECRAVSWGAEAEESEAMKATFGQNLVTLLSCMCWAAVEVPIASYPVTARSVCSGDESCDTNSSGGSSISGSSGSSCTNKTAELERQARLQRGLRAVVALSLLQFEEMRMHFDGRPPVLFQPAWLQSLALDDPDLAVVLWQQLSASGRPTSGHAAGLANWEQYTLQHFHGTSIQPHSLTSLVKL
ncbi:MAG: hypothetical protein WDW38_004870 [Sanguina aurantia]